MVLVVEAQAAEWRMRDCESLKVRCRCSDAVDEVNVREESARFRGFWF